MKKSILINKEDYKKESIQLTEMEIEEIEDTLKRYSIEYPNSDEVQATINIMRKYIPNQKKRVLLPHKMVSILKRSFQEFTYINSFFWLSNILFFLLGFIVIFINNHNPYLTVMTLAPVPFILGIGEIFKNKDKGMLELEMTMKYSIQEIILSKMVIVGSFNLFLNVFFSIVVSVFTNNVFLWKLVLYWMTPFTVVSAIVFVIVSNIKSNYITVGSTLVIWIAISCGIIIMEENISWIEDVSILYYILINFFSLVVILRQIFQLSKEGVNFNLNEC